MFIHHRTEGFVFKKTDWGEADQLFSVFTKDFGKLEVLGRATRKIRSKLRGGISLFSLSEIEFIQGKARKTLTDAMLIEDFGNIKKDSGKLAVAFRISKVFDQLMRGQEKDEKIWQLLNEAFHRLDNYPLPATHYPLIYYYFFWNLLCILGHRPEFYKCLICGGKLRPENLYFSQQGGLVCASCCKKKRLEALKVDASIVKILREVLKRNFSLLAKIRITKEHQGSLRKVSDFYLSFLLSR